MQHSLAGLISLCPLIAVSQLLLLHRSGSNEALFPIRIPSSALLVFVPDHNSQATKVLPLLGIRPGEIWRLVLTIDRGLGHIPRLCVFLSIIQPD